MKSRNNAQKKQRGKTVSKAFSVKYPPENLKKRAQRSRIRGQKKAQNLDGSSVNQLRIRTYERHPSKSFRLFFSQVDIQVELILKKR